MTRNGLPKPVLQRPETHPRLGPVLARFGKMMGRRFTRHNLELMGQVHLAVSALRRSAKSIRGRGANVFTQWVGDPDALGSAVMLKAILEQLGAREVRILTGRLGHPQNRKMVERCGIVLQEPNEQRLPRGLNCMVDTSPPLGMANTTGVQPVRDYFFVADHHADPEDVEANCVAQGVRQVKLAYVGLPVGSTSSFLAAIGLAFDVWERLGPAGRAAVALGIYTDTSALLHGATALDFRMFEKLTRDEATQDVLDELRDYRIPPEWYGYRAAAFQNLESTGSVRIAPVGYVRGDHRDVIAEIASEILRLEGTSISISVAVTERGTEVSVRADGRLLGVDRARIVRVIERLLTETFPGVSGFKYARRPPHRVEGGACVPLTEAQERLWRLSEPGSEKPADPLLDRCRRISHAMVAALQGMKATAPDDIAGLL